MKVAQDVQPHFEDIGDTQQFRQISRDDPEPGRVAPEHGSDRLVLWGLVVAIVLAAGALGVGILSLLSSPDAVAGPQGPSGLQGATGPQGVQGVAGPQGAQGPAGPAGPKGATGATGATGLTGKQGPAGPTGAVGPRGPAGATGASGTVVASTPVSGATVQSATDPAVGTTVTATATCPQGDIALGGGAQVSAPGTSNKNVALRSSYPSTNNGWRAVGSVLGPLGTGEQMTVRPYVLCGKGPHS
jgi:hypothetical protein